MTIEVVIFDKASWPPMYAHWIGMDHPEYGVLFYLGRGLWSDDSEQALQFRTMDRASGFLRALVARMPPNVPVGESVTFFIEGGDWLEPEQ